MQVYAPTSTGLLDLRSGRTKKSQKEPSEIFRFSLFLFHHEHRTIKFKSHCFEFVGERGPQTCGSKLTNRSPICIGTGLLKVENIRERDDFRFHARDFCDLGDFTSPIWETGQVNDQVKRSSNLLTNGKNR